MHDFENAWNDQDTHSSHNLPLFSAIRAFPRDPAELTHPLIQILRMLAQARPVHGPAQGQQVAIRQKIVHGV